MPVRFGPNQFLEYDDRYGVLLCHECQYAIQKSALQSHLLRHKIYRADRQQLLDVIAGLHLLEPDHVPLPPPESPPIKGLPVIAGYRCTAPDCANLCASLKRMKGHWRESHGLADASLTRPVKLQTFFRGTKIRYFEVTPTADDADERRDEEVDDEEMHDQEEGQELTLSIATHIPTPTVNLETLSYFHHFTSTTSLTLPSPQSPLSSAQFWQTHVVPQALRLEWLMCGLLALAACHLVAFTDNKAVEQQHRTRAAEFSSRFRTGWGESVAIATEEVREAAMQIACLLRCAHWALAESASDQRIMPEPGVPEQLQDIVTTIQSSLPPAAPPEPETPVQALRMLSWSSPAPGSKIPTEIWNRILGLPPYMADTFRNHNAPDVFALSSAGAALVECSDTSFATDEVGSAWWGMASWLNRVPLHFRDLVARHDPAALVLVAHWAALLVNRAERCGCWFVRGLSMTILLRIAERLPENDDGAVQRLIAFTIAA
ncbi:Orsellinic acid biosynthesis cluster protein D [Aspergillus mulundensis]|uniref:Orsellinic acid biosynthesis cluster protein D n=1 Tax=Aspergillus mulundensis TaxID=1810919 RepID=A0A3D8T2C3_9EURO|nr:Orsellinic acid biosynthesis cluster protein D [Aspergillus mulundensis]RDW92684.1 Orsellinic acid biosynthesis cluster protein D [Aspergillus mulundensis]